MIIFDILVIVNNRNFKDPPKEFVMAEGRAMVDRVDHKPYCNFMDVHSKPTSCREVNNISCDYKNPCVEPSDC